MPDLSARGSGRQHEACGGAKRNPNTVARFRVALNDIFACVVSGLRYTSAGSTLTPGFAAHKANYEIDETTCRDENSIASSFARPAFTTSPGDFIQFGIRSGCFVIPVCRYKIIRKFSLVSAW